MTCILLGIQAEISMIVLDLTMVIFVSSEIIVDLVISSNTYVSNCMIVSSCRSWALLMVSMPYLESTYLIVFS